MLFVETLLAVMLDPLVVWLERHRVRRWMGITVVALLVFGSVLAFATLIVPMMVSQIREMSGDIPKLRQATFARFPILRQLPPLPKAQQFLGRGLAASLTLIEGITAFIFVLVLAIYLIVEGRSVFEWLVSFAPKEQRPRWQQTAVEI